MRIMYRRTTTVNLLKVRLLISIICTCYISNSLAAEFVVNGIDIWTRLLFDFDNTRKEIVITDIAVITDPRLGSDSCFRVSDAGFLYGTFSQSDFWHCTFGIAVATLDIALSARFRPHHLQSRGRFSWSLGPSRFTFQSFFCLPAMQGLRSCLDWSMTSS